MGFQSRKSDSQNSLVVNERGRMDVLRTEFPKTDRAFPLGDPASRAGPRPRSLPPDSEAALPATQAPDRTSEPVRRRALTFPKTAPNTARAVTPGLGGRPSHARRQDYSLPVRKNPPRLERPPRSRGASRRATLRSCRGACPSLGRRWG
jgi:hypothetical protein